MAIAALVAVSGCGVLPAVSLYAGAAGAGIAWLAAADTVEREAELDLRVAEPVTKALCAVERRRRHDPVVTAALNGFCDHLPTDLPGVLLQAAAVVAAIAEERRTRAVEPAGG